MMPFKEIAHTLNKLVEILHGSVCIGVRQNTSSYDLEFNMEVYLSSSTFFPFWAGKNMPDALRSVGLSYEEVSFSAEPNDRSLLQFRIRVPYRFTYGASIPDVPADPADLLEILIREAFYRTYDRNLIDSAKALLTGEAK